MNLAQTQDWAKAGRIFAPSSFKLATLDQLRAVCNGCGAANAKFDYIPDTIYGTYIGHACQVHDWMYHEGRTDEDKKEADRVFSHNLQRLIDRDCKRKWYKPRWLMHRRADMYRWFVDHRGGPAFWDGKGS